MKKMFWMLAALLVVGCEQSPMGEQSKIDQAIEFWAAFEGADENDTRTYLDEQTRMRWTADDRMTIFKKTTYNREFAFTGKTGANAGGFKQVSVDDDFWFGYDIDYNYAIYPHSVDNAFDETDYFITTTMPAEQTYVENSFGLGANTMVAVSESGQLFFKNVGSYLRVKLWGENQNVKKITLSSIAGEPIAGEAKIYPSLTDDPTCTMVGTTSSIVLNCTEAVEVNTTEDAPVAFWIVVPPIVLAEGYKVVVENSDGDTQEFAVNKEKTFKRNVYNSLTRELTYREDVTMPANNEIWYTSSDGAVVTPYRSGVFGATIVSNSYADGKGVITFDGDVTMIGAMAFDNRTKLTSVTLGNSVTEIGYRAFADSFNLESITIPDSVISIGSGAFEGCSDLISITIGNGVSSIGDYAFRYCDNLTTATIGESVTSVGIGAFTSCNSLTTFYGKFASDGGRCLIKDNAMIAYANASGSTYTIPESVISIGDCAFSGCGNLTDVTIPNNVVSIGDYVFSGCDNLVNVSISSGLASIGNYAFSQCGGLTDVTIPDCVTSIGKDAFQSCSNLTSVTIGNGVTTIGDYAFSKCGKLHSVTIGKSVTSIASCAFSDCGSLARVDISDLSAWCKIGFGSGGSSSNPCWQGAKLYLNGTELTDVAIPADITEIKDYTFFGCSSLTNVTIPESVTTLGRSAFAYCDNLQSVVIGNGVTLMWDKVFYRCSSLVSVYCKPTTPPRGGACAFDDNALDRKIYVPTSEDDSIINNYKTAMSNYADAIVGYDFGE